YLLSYAIRERDSGAVLIRSRVPFRASQVDLDRGGAEDAEDSVAVIDGAYGLRFRYFDRGKGWLPRWPEPRRLPDLIGLEVTDASGTPMPAVVLRPRIDAEAGCVADGSGP